MIERRHIATVAIALAALAALPRAAFSQDYLALTEEGSTLGELSASVTSCRHFGYEGDDVALRAVVEGRVRRAIMDGIEGAVASEMIAEAIRRKATDLRFLADGLNDHSDPEVWARRMGEFAASWVDRCERMSRQFPAVVVADGDEAEAIQRFRDRITGALERPR